MENAVNPLDVCCLWYEPLKGQELGYLLSNYPNLEDALILCKVFTDNLRIHYQCARLKFGNKNVIKT